MLLIMEILLQAIAVNKERNDKNALLEQNFKNNLNFGGFDDLFAEVLEKLRTGYDSWKGEYI